MLTKQQNELLVGTQNFFFLTPDTHTGTEQTKAHLENQERAVSVFMLLVYSCQL